MPRRTLSETGWYHITTRSAGQIALFEDDADRKKYLALMKAALNETKASLIAWVLMTDHVHLIVDFGVDSSLVSTFMYRIDISYSKYFNAKTGRSGTLFQGTYWSKPILNDSQLMATVHYVHMNPELAGISPMRSYRWSSYREYAGLHWVVDTSVVLALFGSFESFDAYQGSPKDVVRRKVDSTLQDGDVLSMAMDLAGVTDSVGLRSLPVSRRDEIIYGLAERRISTRKIARAFGIGPTTVQRILNA